MVVLVRRNCRRTSNPLGWLVKNPGRGRGQLETRSLESGFLAYGLVGSW